MGFKTRLALTLLNNKPSLGLKKPSGGHSKYEYADRMSISAHGYTFLED
jgi:hypothetical protein